MSGQKENARNMRTHQDEIPEYDPLIQQACVLQQLLDHDRDH